MWLKSRDLHSGSKGALVWTLHLPGGTATLTERYKDAAIKLCEASLKSNHVSRRLLALHSIALYFNVLLLAKGINHKTIRRFRLDLGEQARIAINLGIALRKRTSAHFVTLSLSNEYQVIWYAPTLIATLSQLSRVMATLDELSQKVRRLLKKPARQSSKVPI